MNSEIGSNFWITPAEMKLSSKPLMSPIQQCGIPGEHYLWLTSGRQCIEYALEISSEKLPNKIAVIPSYTCHTVVQPFLNRGFEVFTYSLEKDLSTSVSEILDTVEKFDAAVLLVHQYFGFSTIKGNLKELLQLYSKKITIIEDCTHSLYSHIPRIHADFYIASIRKWCGVPDGGFIISKKKALNLSLLPYNKELEEKKCKASLLKYEFLFKGIGAKSPFLTQYREAEDILESQKLYTGITDLSIKIQSNLDIEELKRRRRNNYDLLYRELNALSSVTPLMGRLPLEVVPLYFPILVENRNDLQGKLAENAIYAPIIWPKPDSLMASDVANTLYRSLLCIPVDQRYDADDMLRIVKIIKNEFKK